MSRRSCPPANRGVISTLHAGCHFYLAPTLFDSGPGQWHYFLMSNPLIHPAHDDITASIVADMRKAEAKAIGVAT
jgi:hypothetical protein